MRCTCSFIGCAVALGVLRLGYYKFVDNSEDLYLYLYPLTIHKTIRVD